MNVVIVGGFWFPYGSANAARIRNLALGLRECGARVHVISMVPRAVVDGEASADGPLEHEGIPYECVAPTVASASGWRDADHTIPRLRTGVGDKLRWFGGLYGATPLARRRLGQQIARRECDLVVVYDRSALRMTPLVRLCRARGVPAVLDVVEVSEHLGSRVSPLYWDFAVGTRAIPRLFDGLTVITAGLEALYRTRGCRRVLVVPSIEAWTAAAPPPPTGNAVFRLTYVGALQERDAPALLIEAVRLLRQRGVEVALDVVGHYEGTERGERVRRSCAADPLLRDTVHFRGTLSDRALGEQLQGSDGLLLTRRQARTEELSFPTRLVEYLRYGRPVFVSDVGDVSRYLQDGRDAVLLHPSDPQRSAEAMAEVVGRPDRGAPIGRQGRETGARAFDRRVHAARLLEFAAGLGARRAS
jgi:glycosyltransferase involved in cell wall biosynthesis